MNEHIYDYKKHLMGKGRALRSFWKFPCQYPVYEVSFPCPSLFCQLLVIFLGVGI